MLIILPPAWFGGDVTFCGSVCEVDLLGKVIAEITVIGPLIVVDTDDRVGGTVVLGDDGGAEQFTDGEGFFEVLFELIDGEEGFRVDGEFGFWHGDFPF